MGNVGRAGIRASVADLLRVEVTEREAKFAVLLKPPGWGENFDRWGLQRLVLWELEGPVVVAPFVDGARRATNAVMPDANIVVEGPRVDSVHGILLQRLELSLESPHAQVTHISAAVF